MDTDDELRIPAPHRELPHLLDQRDALEAALLERGDQPAEAG